MSNLTTFAAANLPSVASLSDALRRTASTVAPTGSGVIVKMDKTGHWCFGADSTEVEDDSRWAVNPFSFVHGYIAWGDGEVLSQVMAPITDPLPETGLAPAGAKKGWEVQIGMSVKCLDGEDKDMEASYSATSLGGRKAATALALAIAAQVELDASKPVPVVLLRKDSYIHKSYGRTYVPVFEVVDWMSMDGTPSEPAAEEEAPRRRRRAAA